MTKKFDVAVAIIAHNARADVETCLTKLFEVYPATLSMQVMVLDNTGEDGTPEYVREHWPQVHLIVNEQPQGFGANVNRTYRDSDAHYFLILNPDVTVSRGAIETMVAYMNARPDVGATGPKTFYPDGALQETCRRFPHWGTVLWRGLKLDRIVQPEFYRQFLMVDWDHNESRAVDWIMGSCMLIRAEAFEAIHGFDDNFFLYYEDIDFCRRLWQAAYSVHYVAEAVIIHSYQRSSAHKVNALTRIHLQSIWLYRQKHGLLFQGADAKKSLINFTLLLILADVLLTQIALQLGRYARFLLPILGAFRYPRPTALKPIIYWVVPVIWVVVFTLIGLYRAERMRHLARQKGRVITGILLSGMCLAGVLYALFLYEVYMPRLLLAYFLGFDAVLLVAERELLHRLLSRGGLTTRPRTLLVGVEKMGQDLQRWITNDPQAHVNLIGTRPWPAEEDTDAQRAYVELTVKTVRELKIDELLLTPPWSDRDLLADLVRALRSTPVDIKVVPDFLDLALFHPRLEEMYGVSLVSLRSSAISGERRMVKRLFDLLVAIPACVFLLPIWIAVAIAIRLDSPGPVFFRQQRVGENGRLFWIYKFRSMVADAEARFAEILTIDEHGQLIHKTPTDSRVTRIGRFLRRWSLDELPQLFNIVKGEMSLVGPRPELPFFVSQYDDWQYKRLVVPPGLTGWWQVHNRGQSLLHTSTEDDLYYIEHFSLLLDFKILLKTVGVVLSGKGAY